MFTSLSVQQVIAIIASIAGIIAAYVRFRHIRHLDKVDAFRSNHDLVSKSRFIYSEEALKAYYQYERKCPEKSTMNSLYLIARESWIQVMDLDKIKVTNDAEMYRGNAIFNIMRATLLPDMRKTYSQNLRKYVGAPVFNAGVIAISTDTEADDGIIISAYETRYFDYLNHIGMREMYVAKLIEDSFKKEDDSAKKKLDKMFDKLPMLDLTNRPAVIGACALCFFNNVRESKDDKGEGETYLLVHRRNGKVAEARNTISMTPAGALTWDDDPAVKENRDNMAFYSTIIREFEEEVLGCVEVEWADKYTKPEVLTDRKIFQYKHLGMGLDPLSTKMEQMSMIVVDGGDVCDDLKNYIIKKRLIELDDCKFMTVGDLKRIVNNDSSEGDIHITKVNYENLLRLMLSKESMPVFREAIHQVLRVENAEIRKMIDLKDYKKEHFLKVMDEVNKEVRT